MKIKKFVSVSMLLLLMMQLEAAERVWNPAGNNVKVSSAENWVGGQSPQAGDDLVITNKIASNVVWDIEFAVGDVYLNKANLTLSKTMYVDSLVASNGNMTLNASVTAKNITLGGTGTVTMKTSPITVAEDFMIGGTVKVTHSGPSQFLTSLVEINVGGNLKVASGASINVDNVGRGATNYKDANFRGWIEGTSTGTGGGGAYGGMGTGCLSIMRPYGNIYSPRDYGQRSVSINNSISYGGGIVVICAEGSVVVDGTITSCGGYNGCPAGSGGSIDITAGKFSGSGKVNASGGNSGKDSNSYPGSGGRIAIKLTEPDATFDDFSGTIMAYGGSRSNNSLIAGSGTVFLKTGDEAMNEGTLIVEGKSTKAGYTVLGGDVVGLEFGTLIVTNASLRLEQNAHLKVAGDFLNYGRVEALSGSTVEFVGTSIANIVGDTAFKTLVCRQPGKNLQIKDSALLAVDELCYFSGDRLSRITLASQAGGVWGLKLAEKAASSMANLNLTNCDASQGRAIVAADSSLSGCENITAAECPSGNLVVWTGTHGSSFENAANWNPMRVPLASDGVVVPAGVATSPVMRFSSSLASLALGEGTSLTLGDGVTLAVDGDISVAGNLYGANAKLSLGAKTAIVTVNDALLGELDASKVSVCDFQGRIATQKFVCENLSGAALEFSPGSELTAFNLVLKGDKDNPNVTLGGSGWKLNAMSGVVSGATVGEGCDTSGGAMFELKADPRVLYVKDETVLTEETDLKVEGVKVAFPAAAESVGSLTVGAGAVVTVNGQFTVKRSVVVEKGGKIIWNKPGNVGGNLIVLDGGVITHDNVVGNGVGTVEANKINLNVGGSVFIAKGGKADAKGKGFTRKSYKMSGGLAWEHTQYPEKAISSAHGGRGSGTKLPYGSIFSPTNFGSTATYDNSVYHNSNPAEADFGGGSILIAATQMMVIDGIVDAGGSERNFDGASSSGGSIYLKAGAICGAGEILSCGCNVAVNQNAGAGGRISLVNEKSHVNLFKGKVLAAAGKREENTVYEYYRYGSAGTVYMQYGKISGNGELIIDADRWNRKDNPSFMTDLTPTVACDPEEKKALKHTRVIVKNGGRLMVTEDTTIKDLLLQSDHAYVTIKAGATLRILSFEHPLGESAAQVKMEANAETGETGNIEWLQKGFKIIMR